MDTDRVVVSGKFRKLRVPPIERVSQYRGAGQITVDSEGLIISGRHVLSMGARWGIALALFFGSLMLTAGLSGGAGFIAPGFIPLYFLMEYGWLKREEARVRWTEVLRVATDPKRQLVAIEFDTPSNWMSPAVLSTPLWEDLAKLLTGEAPESATTWVPVPMSKGKAIWVCSWIFFGWWVLFSWIVNLSVLGIFRATGMQDIKAISNMPLRVLLIAIMVAIPATAAFLLARRSYRKRRNPAAVAGAPAIAATAAALPAGEALHRFQSAARGNDDIAELLVQFPGYGCDPSDPSVRELQEKLDKRCSGDPLAIRRLIAVATAGDSVLDRHTTGEGEAWYWRGHAIDAIGRLRAAEAIDPLLGLLKDSSRIAQFYDVIQPAAARALGAIGDPRAAAPLREILAGDKVWASGRKAIVAALETLEGAKVETPEAQLTEAESLCGTGRWDEALAILNPLTEGERASELSEAKRYYAWFLRGQGMKAKGDPDAAASCNRKALESHTGSLDLALAWSHLRESGALESPESVPLLLRALGDEHWKTRAEAARLLGEIGDPSALPALEKASQGVSDVRMLLDHGQRQRFAIAYPGGRIPASEEAMLRQAMSDREREVTEAARAAVDRIRKSVPTT